MKNVIFYFTGTGNNLFLARKLAERIGDCGIYSIKKNFVFEEDLSAYQKIGFVFPVYYYHVPPIFERFVKTRIFSEAQYIFCVASFAGVMGFAQEQMQECIASRGGKVRGQFAVRMPGNAITGYGAFPQRLQERMFSASSEKVQQIAIAVMLKQTVAMKRPNRLIRRMKKSTLRSISRFGENAAKFHCSERCNLCGKCIKICPQNNITAENKKIKWGRDCEQCMACIQWCPCAAINYKNLTAKRKRYRHPEVKFTDIADANQ